MERRDAGRGPTRQGGPEAVSHGAPGTVVRGGEAIPVDLEAEAADFEAVPGPGQFREALERLVADEAYREAALALAEALLEEPSGG